MMLTSAGHRGDAARCQELGVAAYLLKPIRQSELREAIARVLGAHAQNGSIPLITRFSLHDGRDPAASLQLLLAEDNAVNQRLAVRLLEKRGHHVVVAGNGAEALAALEKTAFDLVFMDVQMPEMDGLEATACDPRKGEVERTAPADHCANGPRDEGRSGEMPGGRDGRVFDEADSTAGARRDTGGICGASSGIASIAGDGRTAQINDRVVSS